MYNILDNINSPEDLKNLNKSELTELCGEIRAFLLDNVSKTGGHLASNLGVVELTVALERVFQPERDRLLFDVGHQSYVHKLLTGRREQFSGLRKLGGMAGFPKPSESDCDAFIAGHASDAVSVALGMARARSISGEDYNVVAIVGDGAMTGGLAYEGLSNAGQSGEPIIVILNDNGMSITANVGGVAKLIAHQRSKPGYYSFKRAYRNLMKGLPGGKYIYQLTHLVKTKLKRAFVNYSFFEEMGFHYLGPVDGHNIEKLEYMLDYAKSLKEPVLIHVVTKKGKGYPDAEQNPNAYHGVGPFDPEKGISLACKKSFSSVFGDKLSSLAADDPRICAITAAMKEGTGLAGFAEKFPDRFFDEGIAEGHAVAMAAGMAKQGLIPFVAIYSTFLQRSYDMLIHDVAILGVHVVLCVDRAGLVGKDGETHQGVFDVPFLRNVPNMKIYSPASFAELEMMLDGAAADACPVAIRYPRGGESEYKGASVAPVVLRQGGDVTLVAYGTIINNVLGAARLLEESSVGAEVIKPGVIKPLDMEPIAASFRKTGKLVIIEECVSQGCLGEYIAAELAGMGKILCLNLGDRFIPHGTPDELYALAGLDAESLAETIKRFATGG